MWGQKLGLERIEAVLETLGRPELEIPTVLVAGTNGKGSTAALIASVGHAAGYRTGLYTSPHLESVEERIRIDGRAISSRDLAARLEEVLAVSPALPTYFEALTAASLLQFRRSKVDLAVLEVGLGGRLDATNASDPALSIITQLSLDHQEHLGETLAAIAREKAGILRAGRPALCWSSGDPEVASALDAAARDVGAHLEDCAESVQIEVSPSANGRRSAYRVETARARYALEGGLLGRHQGPNVALAVRAAEELAELGFGHIDEEAIGRGVDLCRWPGRLERVELPDGRWVLLDAAHNPGGVEALLDHLAAGAEHPAALLYGSLRGKAAERSLPRLASRVRSVTLTRPPADRALAPDELAAGAGLDDGVAIEPAPGRALVSALASIDPGEGLLVCGSLYLTGAIRGELNARFGVPRRAVEVAVS